MKLSQKLPLMFALAIGLLFTASLFGMRQLNQSIHVYQHDVMRSVENSGIVAAVEADLLTGLQEWKNVLLRGKNEKTRDEFWAAHLKKMNAVKNKIQELNSVVMDPREKALIENLISHLDVIHERFSKAFEGFKAADNDFAIGDQLSLGITRDSTKVLEELKSLMFENEKILSDQASSSAAMTSQIAYALLVVISLLAIILSIAVDAG